MPANTAPPPGTEAAAGPRPSAPLQVGDDFKGTLVLMLHSFGGSPKGLESAKSAVAARWPHAQILVPALPAATFSRSDPNEIVVRLLKRVDDAIEKSVKNGTPISRIALVGHSLGALLARKFYVVACGESTEAPFEHAYADQPRGPDGLVAARPWAAQVERIVLLAGMNRGWRISHHLSLWRAPLWRVGAAIGHVMSLFGRPPLIFSIRRGADFVTQLRIQWLMMRRRAGGSDARPGSALTVQLLGSRDDIVSPDDNVDLVAGHDFVYLDVPYSGHADVVEMNRKPHGPHRREVFEAALVEEKAQLKERAVIPSDDAFSPGDARVRDVVFVIHGIRDEGFWTHKIARRVRQLAHPNSAVWATETSSYGYFPMLPFLLPWHRRQRVEWLMDQYTEALARYPQATFSYVGHSNGTYLLARALEIYPCCRFRNVVFAGSVVRTRYDWSRYTETSPQRVGSVLNLTATADWVVAFFPKFFQTLRLQDLGSAGHDGFVPIGHGVYQLGPFRGGHGAAVAEPAWDLIAKFVLGAKPEMSMATGLTGRRAKWVRVLGLVPPVVWAGIALSLWGGWVGIRFLLAHFLGWHPHLQFFEGLALAAYLLLLWLVITRV